MENLKTKNVYNEYINYISMRLKPTTILNIKRKFKKHILPFLDKNIYKINDQNYFKWQNYIRQLEYSESFNKQIFSILKQFFDYLEMKYNIKNLAKIYGEIKQYNVSSKKQKIDVWTLKEFNKFIKKVDEPIYHALFNLLFFTGVRKGEALALKFNDLNNQYIIINKNLTKERFNGHRIEMTPKTKKSIRKIRIDYKLKNELNKLQTYYIKKLGEFNENFYLFGGKTPISTTTLDNKKNKWCKSAKVKQIRIHDFRHSHATMLYNKKIKIKYIQERLGHSNISTTINTYIHLDILKYEKRVIKLLNLLKLRF